MAAAGACAADAPPKMPVPELHIEVYMGQQGDVQEVARLDRRVFAKKDAWTQGGGRCKNG
jgi:hypothetical protein